MGADLLNFNRQKNNHRRKGKKWFSFYDFIVIRTIQVIFIRCIKYKIDRSKVYLQGLMSDLESVLYGDV